jgi:DNA primase
MLQESQLFSLLDKVLKQTAFIRKGEEAVYHCPFCSHRKKKLEINVRTQEWHCWICNNGGKSIRSLFYKLKVREQYFEELYKIVGKHWVRPEHKEEQPQVLSLPDEFIPLWKPSKLSEYGIAMEYLQKRGVTMDDILRYNIGYCERGDYRGRVLIPSYDRQGDVNFFAARAFYEGNAYKYMLPPWPKDIIGFELFINWGEPVTLVEGTFDAIAVRNNAIPLFGTTMSDKLKERIVLSGIDRVNIVLDSDEAGTKGAIRIYEFLQGFDINANLVRLEDKDPSVLGFEAITKIIESSKPYTFSDILKAKLSL